MAVRYPSYAGERSELAERVVSLNRVAKVMKGGRRFSFSALLTACSDLVATRGPWGFGDRGLIRADKVAMPGGSSNSSCDGDLKVIRGGSRQEPHRARPGTAASAKVAIPL